MPTRHDSHTQRIRCKPHVNLRNEAQPQQSGRIALANAQTQKLLAKKTTTTTARGTAA
jgi:hypothetical protein